MDATDIGFFHDLLRERREGLMEWLSEASLVEPSSAVKLDSLQQALHRIERNGEVPCAGCDGHVEHEVLLGSPTTSLCLECMEEVDLRKLEDDLRVAQEVDQSLLPRRIPSTESFHFGVHYRPSRILSGDFYDFLVQPDSNKVGLLIGDIAGKGIPAGLLRTTFQATFRTLSRQGLSPAELLHAANQQLLDTAHPGRYATVFHAVLSYETGTLVYANAGHNPPLIRRASGDVETLGATGTVVGILPDARFDQGSVALEPGDVLALYTDGVTEAEDPSGEPFGELRLADLLGRWRRQPVQDVAGLVAGEIDRFAPGEPSDDRTLVICRRAAVPA
jgi:sigma-B regulation protein RsbU (phosphoserine phosphatase)